MAPAFTQQFVFSGKTYPFKARIQRLGGTYVRQNTWVMPAAESAAQRGAQRLLAEDLCQAGIAVQFETVPVQGTLGEIQ